MLMLNAMKTILARAFATTALVAGLSTAALAVDRIAVNVVNDRAFKLSIELRDKVCGGNVALRDQLDAGEIREVEICANSDGVGALRASYGSGCSQVKRTEFTDIAPGENITF